MEIKEIAKQSVQGLLVRTDNEAEMSPELGKIPELWQRFWAEVGVQVERGESAFGVYTNYESDHTGQFDVIAAVNRKAPLTGEDIQTVELPAGKYLVFANQGEMPEVVIEAWQQVWQYFSQPSTHYQRAYTTDFEFYKGADAVEVYIAIK